MKTEKLAVELLEKLKNRGWTLATAESCTGGGIGHALTAISGSSAAYSGGVISYTNAVKERILGVPGSVLEAYGAVSKETACAMAQGVQKQLCADIGVSVTGLAGPDGDGSGKPVGLVYVGTAMPDLVVAKEYFFSGDRNTVRSQAVEAAMLQVLQYLDEL